MTDPRPADALQLAMLRQWCDVAQEALAEAHDEIDALNVYPVPDGDTGTNMYLTFVAAREAIVEAQPQTLESALRLFARGALVGAAGNSGVILSQLLREGADQLAHGDQRRPGALLADTLTRAADAAYAAVGEPVEGTILTVARVAADAAQAVVPTLPAQPFAQLGAVIRAAAEAARQALCRTPDQLPVLKEAGVVDAGGRGLCVLLDAAVEALTGRRPPPAVELDRLPRASLPGADLSADGPGYEVMYLLDADDAEIVDLRRRLARLGESLVIVGGDGLWNVHVHVDEVGAAIEAGIQAGRPHRIRVTHFADSTSRRRAGAAGRTVERGVVAAVAGPGLAALFERAGAVVVSPRGRRWSVGEVLDAIESTRAAEVIVLPNDVDSLPVAEGAVRMARDEGIRASVIPTKAQVQGLAAVAVRQPNRPFDEDVVAMTTAAGHTRHGAITVAVRDAMTMAGPCRTGDTLGVVEGDFALVGGTVESAAIEVVERLLAGGGELVTMVTGADSPEGVVEAVTARLEQTRPDVEVEVYEGGQPRYPLLVGVE